MHVLVWFKDMTKKKICDFQDGKVYTFGEGRYGQLGHNSSADALGPTLVDGLDGPASQISCGRCEN